LLDNHHVSMVSVIWFVLWLAFAFASGLLAHLITDELERHLPIDRRPSWSLLQVRRLPLREVRLHAKMFPDRRGLRRWWTLTTIASGILFLGGATVIVIAGLGRP
jgi:hypothetical protein